MSELVEAAPAYPMTRGRCPFDPPPELDRLQAEEPLSRTTLWDGSTPWLVTRYDHSRQVLADPRISSDPRNDGFPFSTEAQSRNRGQFTAFIVRDDPEHAAQRRLVTADFMIKRVEAMRPRIQQLTDGLIDDILAGPKPVDLVEALALPLPSLVICELLGVPYDDRALFHRLGKLLLRRENTAEQSQAASQELRDYLRDLVNRKNEGPADDLLSRLIVEQLRPGRMTIDDVVDMALLLLIAGHETTANMIALGTVALLEHPDQLDALRAADDPKVVAHAVEELLRYLTIVHNGRRRVALADLEVGGQLIRKGEGVIVATEIANRDEEAFPEPDKLDIHRSARHHVAFGYGVHQCLGQPLARVELQVVYRTLYRRIPTLALAVPLDQVPFKHDMSIYGVHALPVTW
ncbi:cytochrome P450 [Kribbella sp. CA-293567]|uniref:cytochrome P450 n=1 Tax=Kribbella sp. CA-293567 TaxID=3002436 RepID=UPI0022DE42C0|nr:cytochrome P450 [Kribbella sp. CA-293567]WBQ02129.1 cytochrome P450 [Kribbella sp. CA-293567]